MLYKSLIKRRTEVEVVENVKDTRIVWLCVFLININKTFHAFFEVILTNTNTNTSRFNHFILVSE